MDVALQLNALREATAPSSLWGKGGGDVLVSCLVAG